MLEKTIHALFEEQAAKNSEKIALVFNNLQFTYDQLNRQANKLAHYLLNKYIINPDDLICLYLKRDENLLIAILAALKLGAAYVPIAIDCPHQRIQHIIKETNTKLILTNDDNQQIIDNLEIPNITSISIDNQIISNHIFLENQNDPITKVKPNNLAYVIYTSGSTGKPKGVMIEHKSVVNLAIAQTELFGLRTENNETLECLWYANYVFDAHVSEIFTTLINGHTLHLITNEVRQDLNLLQV